MWTDEHISKQLLNVHLNPDIDNQMCDLGPIRRHMVMISDWHWGHVLQIENSYFPNWKSGELYNLPMPRPHCSTNMGMKLILKVEWVVVLNEKKYRD